MTAVAALIPVKPAQPGQPPVAPSKTPALDALEPRQQRFVREYLVDLNGTKAARRAGYSEKAAQEQASRLLSKAMVAAAVAELLAIETGVTRTRVIHELARLAFSDIGDVADVDAKGNFKLKAFAKMQPDARVAIASIKQKPNEYGQEREIKLHDKLGALNTLAKVTGLLRDAPAVAIQNNINVGVMMAPEVASEDEWEAEMNAERQRASAIENNLRKVA